MRWHVLVVSSIIIGCLIIVSVRWRSYTPPATPHHDTVQQTKGAVPDIHIRQAKLVEHTEHTPAWEVVAHDIKFYDAQQRAALHRMQGQIFRQMSGPLHIGSTHGQVHSSTGDITLWGDVQLQHPEGYFVETETLHWSATSRTLHTDATVAISGTAVRIAGVGLHSYVDQQSFTLQHDVRALFYLQ